MKTVGTYTIGFPTGAPSSGTGWHGGGYGIGSLTYTATRKGQKVYFTNISLHYKGYNSDYTKSVSVSPSIRNSSYYSYSSGSFSCPADTVQEGYVSFNDFWLSVGTANSVAMKSYTYTRLAGEQYGNAQGVTDITLDLPAYTPPTYGSVNDQSEFIDTLYGSASWAGYTPSSVTATSIAGLVTDWNAYGGSTIDAKGVQRHPNLMCYKKDSSNIYLLLAYPKYNLDHNNWSNSIGVWKYVTIPRLQFGSILCDKDSTQGGFKDGITSSSSTWQSWANSAATGDFNTIVRFAGNNVSVKLDKLYGSVNGVAKRIY